MEAWKHQELMQREKESARQALHRAEKAKLEKEAKTQRDISAMNAHDEWQKKEKVAQEENHELAEGKCPPTALQIHDNSFVCAHRIHCVC